MTRIMLTDHMCLNVTISDGLNLSKIERLMILGERISNKSEVKRIEIDVYNTKEIEGIALQLMQKGFNNIFSVPLTINKY